MRKWRKMLFAARFLAFAFLLLKSSALLAAACAVDLSQFPLDDPRALAVRVKASPLWGSDGNVTATKWQGKKSLYSRGEVTLHALVDTNDAPAGKGLVPILYALATAVNDQVITAEVHGFAQEVVGSCLWNDHGSVCYAGQSAARSIMSATRFAALAIAAGLDGGAPAVQAFHVLATEVLRLFGVQEENKGKLAELMKRAKHGRWFGAVRSAAQAFEAEQKRLAAEENARRKADIKELQNMLRSERDAYRKELLRVQILAWNEKRKAKKRQAELAAIEREREREEERLREERAAQQAAEVATHAEEEAQLKKEREEQLAQVTLLANQRGEKEIALEAAREEGDTSKIRSHTQAIEALDRRVETLVKVAREAYERLSKDSINAARERVAKEKAAVAAERKAQRKREEAESARRRSMFAQQRSSAGLTHVEKLVSPRHAETPRGAATASSVGVLTPGREADVDPDGIFDHGPVTLGDAPAGTFSGAGRRSSVVSVSDILALAQQVETTKEPSLLRRHSSGGIVAPEDLAAATREAWGDRAVRRDTAATKTSCMPNLLKALWERMRKGR